MKEIKVCHLCIPCGHWGSVVVSTIRSLLSVSFSNSVLVTINQSCNVHHLYPTFNSGMRYGDFEHLKAPPFFCHSLSFSWYSICNAFDEAPARRYKVHDLRQTSTNLHWKPTIEWDIEPVLKGDELWSTRFGNACAACRIWTSSVRGRTVP